MKTLKTLLGYFILITLLSGCSVGYINETPRNVLVPDPTPERQAAKKEDFIIGFNPFRDDPDNPSPHNPLVKKFGDIPEVRTYIRLKQKLRHGLNVDEAIELYTAEYHLYPSDATKANLKQWKKDKERYERLGISPDKLVLRYNIEADPSDEKPAVTEETD